MLSVVSGGGFRTEKKVLSEKTMYFFGQYPINKANSFSDRSTLQELCNLVEERMGKSCHSGG